MYELDVKEKKIKDINAIDFGDNVDEISTSLEIVLTMFEINDDKEILFACKQKLHEGVMILKKLGLDEKSKMFEK